MMNRVLAHAVFAPKFWSRALRVVPISALLLFAGDPSWKNKPIPDWTEDDARQVLSDSPWVRTVRVAMNRLQTESERRDGGNMGQEHGVGFDGVDPKKPRNRLPPGLFGGSGDARAAGPPVTLRLCWESALPVRAAELKARIVEPPTLAGDGYSLAVYGIPGSYFKADPEALGAPLKKDAVLRRAGKKDVKPSSVEVFQRADGLVVVYLFPLSAEITVKDGRIEFNAQIGRLGIAQYFDTAEMQFGGKLEI
jgi:hypothetical protein